MDGLSSASAVFAVVSVAAKLAEGIKKLHEFRKAVQNAPEHVSTLFNEFDSVGTILAMCHDVGRESELDKASESVLLECEKHVADLLAKLQKSSISFESSSRRKRALSRFCHALKRDEIEPIRASIANAKLTLLLSNSLSIRLEIY